MKVFEAKWLFMVGFSWTSWIYAEKCIIHGIYEQNACPECITHQCDLEQMSQHPVYNFCMEIEGQQNIPSMQLLLWNVLLYFYEVRGFDVDYGNREHFIHIHPFHMEVLNPMKIARKIDEYRQYHTPDAEALFEQIKAQITDIRSAQMIIDSLSIVLRPLNKDGFGPVGMDIFAAENTNPIGGSNVRSTSQAALSERMYPFEGNPLPDFDILIAEIEQLGFITPYELKFILFTLAMRLNKLNGCFKTDKKRFWIDANTTHAADLSKQLGIDLELLSFSVWFYTKRQHNLLKENASKINKIYQGIQIYVNSLQRAQSAFLAFQHLAAYNGYYVVENTMGELKLEEH